jgi:serine/threonine protein kinase
MLGGKIIGEGSYGCAFYPPLECTKPIQKKKKVGKIVNEHEADQEFSISLALKEIPYAKEYFVLVEDVCIPKPRAKQQDKNIKCKPINSDGIKLEDTFQLITDYAGITLQSLITIQNNQFNITMCRDILQQILEGGALLLLGGIVHSDLSANNVLVDKLNTRFIDFGTSWSHLTLMPDYIPPNNYDFTPGNTAVSPESSVISGIINDYDYNTIIARIGDEKIILTDIYKLLGTSVDSQLKELELFLKNSYTFRDANWLSFYKIYWSKRDAWAIGCILVKMLNAILMTTDSSDIVINDLLECAQGLCCMDPGKRLDATEALERIAPDSKILKHPEVAAWLVKQKQMRNELMKKIGTR